MAEGEDDSPRDLGALVVPAAGGLVETGDLWEPYCLSGPGGGRVEPVSEFLRDLQAAGRPATTQRSYSLALLRWFRFTWAVDVPWDQATRTEAPRLLPASPALGQARAPAGRAASGAGQAARVREVRAVDGGALRDGLPELAGTAP